MGFKTGKELLDAYNNGFEGCKYDQKEMDALMSELKYPLFGSVAKGLVGSGVGKLSIPYRSVVALSPEAPYKERQELGDCVSHGNRNACDITRAVEIHIDGEAEDFVTLGATEAIYGARGYSGDGGMTCSRAVSFITKDGGVLLRKKYGDFDLSKYSSSLAYKWGRGIPDLIVAEAKKHQMKTASLIRSIEELRDALANGYGVAVCSGQGFSSTRDKDGFAAARGSWAHCMCIAGFDDYSPRKGVLIINSWGENWISGPMPSWGPIPKGSFMAEIGVVERMIRSGGTFAFSKFDGFPPQNLPDYGNGEF